MINLSWMTYDRFRSLGHQTGYKTGYKTVASMKKIIIYKALGSNFLSNV